MEPLMGHMPELQHQVLLDDDGTEYTRYTIDGAVVDEPAFVAQQQANADLSQKHMIEVSRYLEQRDIEAAAANKAQAAINATRREAAHAELSALGLSAETIDTIVRGL